MDWIWVDDEYGGGGEDIHGGELEWDIIIYCQWNKNLLNSVEQNLMYSFRALQNRSDQVVLYRGWVFNENY